MYFDWQFQCHESACYVFVQRGVSVTGIQRSRHHKAQPYTQLHTPHGGGSISSMKRSPVIIYCFYSFWNMSSSHWQKAPFGVTLPSKQNKKANQVLGVISDCTTHTHTHVNIDKLDETLCAASCFFLFASARLDAATLIPALQVAAQEAGLHNSGPCACLKSLSLVMRVWLTQLVCLSANWVCLQEKKRKKKYRVTLEENAKPFTSHRTRHLPIDLSALLPIPPALCPKIKCHNSQKGFRKSAFSPHRFPEGSPASKVNLMLPSGFLTDCVCVCVSPQVCLCVLSPTN